MDKVYKALENYDVGEILDIRCIEIGHINDTYKITTSCGGSIESFILQSINHNVFKDVDGLMENIKRVTDFLWNKIKQIENSQNKCLRVILTKEDKYYVEIDGKFFRLYNYIENSISYDIVANPRQFFDVAVAFSNFQKLLEDFDASSLIEVIPNFHNTPSRYENLLEALEKDEFCRAEYCKYEIDFVKSQSKNLNKIQDMLSKNLIPTRICHNDCKLNNILFDSTTGETLCIVDLDTIMPGSFLYDFGDAIRSGCNCSTENDKIVSNVKFDFELYKVYVKGTLSVLNDVITDVEKQNLSTGAILMTIECGIRFLTDFLKGDTYFKVEYPSHNLVRARTQFKLASDMIDRSLDMQSLIDEIICEL